MKVKVQNMTSARGNDMPNQFIIETDEGTFFQSYDSVIAVKRFGCMPLELDERYWDYSVTTGKYRNQFLGENKAETQAKIDSGVYILTNLN